MDLGKYAGAVLSSYAIGIALILLLVAVSIWKRRSIRREIARLEESS